MYKFRLFLQKMFDNIHINTYNCDIKNQALIFLFVTPDGNNNRKKARTMKSTGIVRKVDELGRIVLPIEIRRNLDIAERDELEIFMENDQIILQKYEPNCVFCSSSYNLVSYKGKNVCRDCIGNMNKA